MTDCHADIPTYYFTAFGVHLQEFFFATGADWGFVQILPLDFVQLAMRDGTISV